MVVEAASKLVASGAFHGSDLRRAREAGLRKNTSRIANIQCERNRIMGVFKSFDLDGDGVLSKDEFACALQRVNPELRDSQVREYARHIDRDKNGAIPWAEFCEKLSSAAETCTRHTPSFLKGSRWIDHGDIVGNTDEDEQRRTGSPVPIDFRTTAHEDFGASSRSRSDAIAAAGMQSSKLMTRDRVPLLFEEWDGQRRGRGVSVFQSGGLRFDDRGFQTNTVGRAAPPPMRHRSVSQQQGRHSSAVRECLQPGFAPGPPSTPVHAAGRATPRSTERVLHLISVRACARPSAAGHAHRAAAPAARAAFAAYADFARALPVPSPACFTLLFVPALPLAAAAASDESRGQCAELSDSFDASFHAHGSGGWRSGQTALRAPIRSYGLQTAVHLVATCWAWRG
jgi:hypothetical protein